MNKTYLVLRRKPQLLRQLPARCRCGTELPLDREFMDERFCGIETTPCPSCGSPPSIIGTYRRDEDQEEMVGLFAKSLEPV